MHSPVSCMQQKSIQVNRAAACRRADAATRHGVLHCRRCRHHTEDMYDPWKHKTREPPERNSATVAVPGTDEHDQCRDESLLSPRLTLLFL